MLHGDLHRAPPRLGPALLPPDRPPSPDARPDRLRPAVPPVPTPGAVVWWLLGHQEKLCAEQTAYLERLTTLRSQLALAQQLVQEFFFLPAGCLGAGAVAGA